MLSCQHQLRDDRIYWKEALSLKKAGYQLVHIGAGSEASDYVTAEGIRLITIPRKRYFKNALIDKLFRTVTFRKDITQSIFDAANAIQAGVYHFHDLQINKIGARLKNLPHRPKIIYDVHESYGDLIRDHSPRLLKPFNYLYALHIEKWELKKAQQYDAIIVTEEYILNKFRQPGPAHHCEIIYNYSYFSATPHTGYAPALYDAIYSGSISKLRGIYEIVQAVQLLKKSKPAIKVIVIGSFVNNQLQQHITSLIKQHNLVENLVIHEAVPFEGIDAFYRNSKIGLCIFHPVKLHKNAVFIKTFEYMAFGLPVVGSNFGSVAHYIEAADAGEIVDPLQPGIIASSIKKLLDDTLLYEKYSTNGLRAVKEKYNWQQEEKKLLSLYEKILPVSKQRGSG